MHKLLFDIHRWLGVILIVYVLAICVTGSVLVYRNELYRTFSPQPVYVQPQPSYQPQPIYVQPPYPAPAPVVAQKP